ncbi:hypothetical protein [Leucobacter luti]|uniref:CHAP domain-containing protein n=1 Tax=Leucobacter luti TaxID=340320 RepID=A0A4Q7U055_9MICO|nr:hypothetical protein [Leucobacter luti]MBL3699252.1 hypothetical protein [Leucobacter luti]RZT66754.1 hypothetical protein EV139_0881 [Leucobacter luti]
MSQIVENWAAALDGQYIDMDGYGNPIYQCHDIWLSYLVSVAGGTQHMGYAPSDFTDSVFTAFPTNGVDAVMTKHYGTDGIRSGDVVFWSYGSAHYPWSHVAVALAPPVDGYVPSLTQNPGPAHREYLTLQGALGYLRPKNLPDDPITPEPIDKDKPVAYIYGVNSSGTQSVAGGTKRWVETGPGASAIASGAGQYMIETTYDLTGVAGTRVALTSYRITIAANGSETETMLEEIDVTLQPNGRARRQLIIANNLNSNERLRVRITVPSGSSTVKVARYSFRGYKWAL